MPTLSERLMKVALLGVVPADDQHVIADANAEIERLRAALDQIHMIARHPRSTGERMILAVVEAVDEQDGDATK